MIEIVAIVTLVFTGIAALASTATYLLQVREKPPLVVFTDEPVSARHMVGRWREIAVTLTVRNSGSYPTVLREVSMSRPKDATLTFSKNTVFAYEWVEIGPRRTLRGKRGFSGYWPIGPENEYPMTLVFRLALRPGTPLDATALTLKFRPDGQRGFRGKIRNVEFRVRHVN